MLYYVTCGNDFTLEFGDIDESFYDSMESIFARIIETLVKRKDKTLASKFLPQLEVEFKRVEWMGWGYGDGLKELLDDLKQAFPEISEAVA